MHTISFGFTITGALDDAKVYGNGMRVNCSPMGSGKYAGGFEDALIKDNSTLEIQFHLFGAIGTSYTIEYKFLDNGTEEVDPSKPPPVRSSITSNNKKVERISFRA